MTRSWYHRMSSYSSDTVRTPNQFSSFALAHFNGIYLLFYSLFVFVTVAVGSSIMPLLASILFLSTG